MVLQSTQLHRTGSKSRGNHAVLFMDGTQVGTVEVKGWMASWGYGDFTPDHAFSSYAPIFGAWSLLMHADGETERLSREASRELTEAEHRLDSIKARLFFPHASEWVEVAALTIDGTLLEWKEY
jgi:hypothetical protein